LGNIDFESGKGSIEFFLFFFDDLLFNYEFFFKEIFIETHLKGFIGLLG